jgi:hypothetical protein
LTVDTLTGFYARYRGLRSSRSSPPDFRHYHSRCAATVRFLCPPGPRCGTGSRHGPVATWVIGTWKAWGIYWANGCGLWLFFTVSSAAGQWRSCQELLEQTAKYQRTYQQDRHRAVADQVRHERAHAKPHARRGAAALRQTPPRDGRHTSSHPAEPGTRRTCRDAPVSAPRQSSDSPGNRHQLNHRGGHHQSTKRHALTSEPRRPAPKRALPFYFRSSGPAKRRRESCLSRPTARNPNMKPPDLVRPRLTLLLQPPAGDAVDT